MNKLELNKGLTFLGISHEELPKMLSISARTAYRWITAKEEIPSTMAATVNAWILLKRAGLPWKPSEWPKNENWIQDQVIDIQRLAKNQKNIIAKIEENGGPSCPWEVNVKECIATLGPIRLSFYLLKNGSFTPAFYSRSDKETNIERDFEMLEDAIYCINDSIEKQKKGK